MRTSNDASKLALSDGFAALGDDALAATRNEGNGSAVRCEAWLLAVTRSLEVGLCPWFGLCPSTTLNAKCARGNARTRGIAQFKKWRSTARRSHASHRAAKPKRSLPTVLLSKISAVVSLFSFKTAEAQR
jgi:hypothetical protein